jgi:hypothetical protein
LLAIRWRVCSKEQKWLAFMWFGPPSADDAADDDKNDDEEEDDGDDGGDDCGALSQVEYCSCI